MKQTKNKSNKKAAIMCGLAAVMAVAGASAFLTATQSAEKDNQIKPGKIEIVFENEMNEINLTDAVPMWSNYANANLTPHTFELRNNGTMDLDYVVYPTDITGLPDGYEGSSISLISPVGEGFTYVGDLLISNLENPVFSGKLAAGESVSHSLIAHLNETVKAVDGFMGKNISFKLSAYATQSVGEAVEPESLTYNYNGTVIPSNVSGINRGSKAYIALPQPADIQIDWATAKINYVVSQSVYDAEGNAIPREFKFVTTVPSEATALNPDVQDAVVYLEFTTAEFASGQTPQDKDYVFVVTTHDVNGTRVSLALNMPTGMWINLQ